MGFVSQWKGVAVEIGWGGCTVMYGPLKQFEFPGHAFPPLTLKILVPEYIIVYINLTVI